MNKMSFKLACAIALTLTYSLFGAQAELSGLDRELEIVALIDKVSKQVVPVSQQSELSNRQLLNDQAEIILTIPQQFGHDTWEIPLSSGLQKFAGTPLEVIVPYVLKKLGASFSTPPTPRELFQRKISLERSIKQMRTIGLKIGELDATCSILMLDPFDFSYLMHYQWALKSENILTFNRWTDGQIKICDGKNYQCREGRVVCEDDLDVTQGVSFEQYCDEARMRRLMF